MLDYKKPTSCDVRTKINLQAVSLWRYLAFTGAVSQLSVLGEVCPLYRRARLTSRSTGTPRIQPNTSSYPYYFHQTMPTDYLAI